MFEGADTAPCFSLELWTVIVSDKTCTVICICWSESYCVQHIISPFFFLTCHQANNLLVINLSAVVDMNQMLHSVIFFFFFFLGLLVFTFLLL